MSPRSLILVGGGEHARVVAEAVRTMGDSFALEGFVDPAACEETVRRLGLTRLGGDEFLAARPDAWLALGVGTIGVSNRRQSVVERLASAARRWAIVVHGSAWVSPTASLGEGAVVMAGAMIQSGAKIGAHCVVNTGAVVEHDAVLGDFVQVGPGAVLGGGVHIGAGSYVGLGACVRDHIRIGSGALVGMGAVVVSAVEDGARVVGTPAKGIR